ncbi:DUF2181 domain-containing protein [uncultured Polaribacter sp.]|uniref:DUF2181 domain-containing protein n=1 Tax=uncultured Polaribacter sp. TaxID=174711 RepID=UPI002634E982|nr:DUF2181 domain-containing protein [uncultured Polaribacter sp.]
MKKSKHKLILLYLFIFYLTISIIVNFQNEFFTYFYKEKIWVHRVNSIEKLKETNSKFNGIELDVVFNTKTNVFDVNHPPAKSINLSLYKYLSSIKLNSNNLFWIDFKNLSTSNKINACLKLEKLCFELKLKKKQLIIESSNPQALDVFYSKGYQTSFYLPANLVSLNTQKLEEEIKSIQNIISENKTTYLSTDKRDYHIIKKYFPEHKLLIWSFYYFNKKTINPYHLLHGLNYIYYKLNILPDNNVYVTLFKYEGKAGNR